MINSPGIIEGPLFAVYNATGGTLAQFARVKVVAARVNGAPSVDVCGVGDICVGILQVAIPTLKFGSCRFENASGNQMYIASKAIAAGAPIFAAAAGKVTDATGLSTSTLGAAFDAAAADGDVITAVHNPPSLTAAA